MKYSTSVKHFKHDKDAGGESIGNGEKKEKYPNVVDAGNVNGYKLTGLMNDTVYYVAVSAYNGAGESGNSDTDPNKPGAQPASAQPEANIAYAPNNLKISPRSNGQVTLDWEASMAEALFDGFEDNDSAGWTVESGSFSVVDHPDASRNAKVYKSSSLDPNGGTTPLQAAVNGEGSWDDYEAESKLTVNDWNSNGFAGIAARYSKDADNNETSYRFIYEKASNTFKIQKFAGGTITKLAESEANAIAATDNLNDMKLKLKVAGSELTGTAVFSNANNGAKEIELTATDSTVISGKPALISRNQETYFDQVIARKSNTANGGYKVYRSLSPYEGYELVAELNAPVTSYTDTGLTAGMTYYYKVKGVKGVNGDQNNRVVSVGSSNIIAVTP
ncbi:MAG: cbhB [Paenibacillus sp.]|nr:cbhB [Paenibacillus sp.]